jgi:hypothetical protein
MPTLWCAKNCVLNQFSHSLLIEIPSRNSLLARTKIKTQDRQEAAVGAVSAVSACHRETVLDSTDYRCRSPELLRPPQATVPRAVAAAAGGGRRRSARQEQSACRSSRESFLHDCQSARAIRSPEREDIAPDNPLAGARGHAARDLLAGERTAHFNADKQTIAFNGERYSGSQISSNSGRLRPDDLFFAQAQKREQYKVVLLKMLPWFARRRPASRRDGPLRLGPVHIQPGPGPVSAPPKKNVHQLVFLYCQSCFHVSCNRFLFHAVTTPTSMPGGMMPHRTAHPPWHRARRAAPRRLRLGLSRITPQHHADYASVASHSTSTSRRTTPIQTSKPHCAAPP